jgi:hypothetical protein
MVVFDRGLGGDGWATFAFLESAIEDRDLFLENNTHGVMNGLLPGPGGHLVMQYPPGLPLLDLAPFLVGRALDRLLPARWLASAAVVPPVGRVSRRVFLEVAAIVAARNVEVLLGLLALVVALRTMGFGERTAAAATALVFFGGPLVFYSLVGASHAPTFALAGLLLLVLVRDGGGADTRTAVLAGLIIGFATLMRYSACALLPVVLLATWARPPWRRWSAALVGFLLPLAILPAYFIVHYGRWAPIGYGGALHPTVASPWNVLFSGHHGLFVFHPALALAAVGLALGALGRIRPGNVRLYRLLVVWFGCVALLHGWWSEWANPGGYGQRFLIDALPALAVGVAALVSAARWRVIVLPALAVTAVFGYALFFTAVGGLVRSPGGAPWPQTLGDYESLVRRPPSFSELGRACMRASFSLRALAGEMSPPR